MCSALLSSSKILHQNRETMTTALIQSVIMWKHWKLHALPPKPDELNSCLQYLENLPCADTGNRENVKQIKLDRSVLIACEVGKHFDYVAHHRKWIKLTYELLKMAGVAFSIDMDRRIDVHDLSKYGPDEALDYSIMLKTTRCYNHLNVDKHTWRVKQG